MKQGDPYGQQPKAFQFMTRFVIPSMVSDGDYLVRWRIIQTPWFSLYLHKILTTDVPPQPVKERIEPRRRRWWRRK